MLARIKRANTNVSCSIKTFQFLAKKWVIFWFFSLPRLLVSVEFGIAEEGPIQNQSESMEICGSKVSKKVLVFVCLYQMLIFVPKIPDDILWLILRKVLFGILSSFSILGLKQFWYEGCCIPLIPYRLISVFQVCSAFNKCILKRTIPHDMRELHICERKFKYYGRFAFVFKPGVMEINYLWQGVLWNNGDPWSLGNYLSSFFFIFLSKFVLKLPDDILWIVLRSCLLEYVSCYCYWESGGCFSVSGPLGNLLEVWHLSVVFWSELSLTVTEKIMTPPAFAVWKQIWKASFSSRVLCK